IGENGAGKSTALEIINFLFKKVLFKEFNLNNERYNTRNLLQASERKDILNPGNSNSYVGFRLDPNWKTPDKSQKIKLTIELDDIDLVNIRILEQNAVALEALMSRYSHHTASISTTSKRSLNIEVSLNKDDH